MAVGKGACEDLTHSDSAGGQSRGGQHRQSEGGAVEAEGLHRQGWAITGPSLGSCLHTQAWLEHHGGFSLVLLFASFGNETF